VTGTAAPLLVSVVIPTRDRPELLSRAVASLRAQTRTDWEAVVVVDGRDPVTEALLAAEPDPRIRAVVNEVSVGGGEARNIGIRAATGTWIGLLDDDDEWLPTRIERQLAALGPETARDDVIAFSRMIVRTPHGDYVWPRRGPAIGEPVSEYLFLRRSLFAGEGGIQTSSIMAPRALFLAVPFDPALPRYQDTDWLLRAAAGGATLRYCAETLTVWHAEQPRVSIARRHARDWAYARQWIADRRPLVTPRAYAAFLLIRGGGLTAAARNPGAGLGMLVEAFRHGRPTVTTVLLFLGKWVIPVGLRRSLRATLSRGRRRGRGATPRPA
jgi:glycosyltransferase involved in cell wall biosynthesis